LELTVSSSIFENSLNDSMYPNNGRLNNITLELATPLGDLNYYKLDLNHSSYYPVQDDLTVKLGANIGVINSYNNTPTPFYKKYFGGGSSSIRGFDFNSLGPKYENGSVKGGEVSVLATSSIISPLTFIDNSNNMRVGAFVDVGAINNSIADFDFNELRASTGVAFSWYTPIGPIGINWSKPLISKVGDQLESISFNLGTTF